MAAPASRAGIMFPPPFTCAPIFISKNLVGQLFSVDLAKGSYRFDEPLCTRLALET